MTTQAAQTAKEIRSILRKKFPQASFKVTSHNYAGGDSVHIIYEADIAEDQVWREVRDFQYGHFDGMTDCYEYSNVIDGKPQVRFVLLRKIFI